MLISNGNTTIELDDILDYKTELEILNFYLEIDSLPTIINSPLREDREPSFQIDYDENGHVRFYDFGGRNEHGGLFDLLMSLYQLSFSELLSKIYSEMIIGKSLNKIIRNKNISIKKHEPKISKLNVKIRKLRQYDLDFWMQGNISEEWLKFGDIYPISHIFITKNDREMIIPADRYAYVYIEFKDNIPTYKIYQPFSEKYKWINKHDKSVWDLWTKLPETGENLIITKSRKDALTIWANTGIPSTCLQAESISFKNNVVQQIDSRFTNKFILYDNDWNKPTNWGRQFGQKVSKQLGFKQIEFPDKYEVTDSFEFVSKYGKEKFIEIINKLINNKN